MNGEATTNSNAVDSSTSTVKTPVKIFYGVGKELTQETRTAKNIKENDFIEIKLTNTIPDFDVEKIVSPADKILQVVSERNIKIKLQ